MKDFIICYNPVVLDEVLVEKGLVNEEGEPVLGLPTIPAQMFGEEAITVVRCPKPKDERVMEDLIDSKAVELMGFVEKNEYAFSTIDAQMKYEMLVKVGKMREEVPVLDDEGNLQLDENGDLLKEYTTHPYMIGLFA